MKIDSKNSRLAVNSRFYKIDWEQDKFQIFFPVSIIIWGGPLGFNYYSFFLCHCSLAVKKMKPCDRQTKWCHGLCRRLSRIRMQYVKFLNISFRFRSSLTFLRCNLFPLYLIPQYFSTIPCPVFPFEYQWLLFKIFLSWFKSCDSGTSFLIFLWI